MEAGITEWVPHVLFAGLSGAFLFLYRRSDQVHAELREELKEMRDTSSERAREGKADRDAIWLELRNISGRISEQIGRIPTRDEVKSDLRDLEARLTKSTRAH